MYSTPILALAAVALAKTIEVEVGGSGLVFTPNSVTAAQGDKIYFKIDATHNVAQANFNNPCQPSGDDALFSGDGVSSFTITVHNAKPMWFYCATASHCADGQVFAVNPTSDKTVEMFADKAKDAGAGVAPSAVNDGSSGSASSSSGAPSSGMSESTAAGGMSTSASSAAATGTPSYGPASMTGTTAMASGSAATSATSSGLANSMAYGASSEYLLVGLSGVLAAIGLL